MCKSYTTQVVDSEPGGRGEGKNAYVKSWIMDRNRDSSGYGGSPCRMTLKRPLQNPIVNILIHQA